MHDAEPIEGHGYTVDLKQIDQHLLAHIFQKRPRREFDAMLPLGSGFLFRELILEGQYIRTLRKHRPYLEPQDELVVVDAGANYGLFGLFAEALLGDITLHGFEPLQENLELLEFNWRHLNSRIHPVALSDQNGEAELHLTTHTGSTIRAEEALAWAENLDHPAPPTRTVPTVTLDSLNLPRLDVLKLDIEGSEEAALYGAYDTISQFHPLVICSYEHYTNDEAWLRECAQLHGYRVTDDPDHKVLAWVHGA